MKETTSDEAQFLRFLDNDMRQNPDRIQPLSAELINTALELVGPLNDDD